MVLQPLSSSLLLCSLLLCCDLHQCCFTCLITMEERQGLCQYMANISKMETPDGCEKALRRGFGPLENTTIPHSQLRKIERYLKTLDKEVRLMDELSDPASWHNLFKKKMAEYVKGVQVIASGHPVAVCKPPCGLQKQARKYNCRECIEEDCDLPVACGLVDIHVKENKRTEMSCRVTFTLPESYNVIWKFAKNLRVTDLSYFKFQQRLDVDLDYIIRITLYDHHRGTYACEIQDEDDDILAEKFFFVNVSRRDRPQGLYLKRRFKQIIASAPTNRSIWAPRMKEEPEDYSDFFGFLDLQKPLSGKTLIFITVTVFVFFLLVTLLSIMSVYYISDED